MSVEHNSHRIDPAASNPTLFIVKKLARNFIVKEYIIIQRLVTVKESERTNKKLKAEDTPHLNNVSLVSSYNIKIGAGHNFNTFSPCNFHAIFWLCGVTIFANLRI